MGPYETNNLCGPGRSAARIAGVQHGSLGGLWNGWRDGVMLAGPFGR